MIIILSFISKNTADFGTFILHITKSIFIVFVYIVEILKIVFRHPVTVTSYMGCLYHFGMYWKKKIIIAYIIKLTYLRGYLWNSDVHNFLGRDFEELPSVFRQRLEFSGPRLFFYNVVTQHLSVCNYFGMQTYKIRSILLSIYENQFRKKMFG